MAAPLQPLIQSRILSLRGQRVMLDADLAQLYGVETRAVVQAAKRNAQRFPADFMFQLLPEEWDCLRSQTVISNVSSAGRGGRRTAKYDFTAQGVAMLSSVLSSEQAAALNIEIMRTFLRVRELATTHQDLAKRLAELEMKSEGIELSHDTFSRNTRAQLKQVFDAIRELITPPDPPKQPIGFVPPEDKSRKSKATRRQASYRTGKPLRDHHPDPFACTWRETSSKSACAPVGRSRYDFKIFMTLIPISP